MVATYTLNAQAVTIASAKNMLAIYNAAGSGKIVKVTRIVLQNNQTAAVAGAMSLLQIGGFSGAPTGGTSVTFIKHDTSSAAPPAQVTAVYGPTVITINRLFRQICWGDDEVSTTVDSTVMLDELCIFPALTTVWDAGYGNTDVQPITLREGEGCVVQFTATGTFVGNMDLSAELTIT